jgi:hypothetical protein
VLAWNELGILRCLPKGKPTTPKKKDVAARPEIRSRSVTEMRRRSLNVRITNDRADASMEKRICTLAELSHRIERAARRRGLAFSPIDHAGQIWAAAAARLLDTQRTHRTVPLDPELFVAAQTLEACGYGGDAWDLLASADAAARYVRLVRQIVSRLKKELRLELYWSNKRIRGGASIKAVLSAHPATLSPLGRYIIAVRAGEPALAELFRPEAREQHRVCPLYRHACHGLLPCEHYPVIEPIAGLELDGQADPGIPAFSLN